MTIHLGIIGCGGHAEHHARHLPGFHTEIVWDPSPAAMEKIDSFHKAATLEELFASHIEAVLICSPDEHHLTQIEMALAAGKHIFCEKPLLVDGQELGKLEDAFKLADEKKLVLTSCHPRRFDRPFEWLSHELSRFVKDFGAPLHFSFDFSYHKPSNEWKHTRSLLLDHLNHEVDLMNYLFGIDGFDAMKLHDGFDRYEVAGKRDDKLTFHFMGTRRLAASKYPEWCSIRFERAEVKLDMLMGVAYVIDHEKGTTLTVSNLGIDYDGRLEKVMKNFADSIEWSKQGYSDAGKRQQGYYLLPGEMLMNTESGLVLQYEGMKRISVRR